MGYVLPYGQISLWGATVITNLISAIPWVGEQLVQFIYPILKITSLFYVKFYPQPINTIIASIPVIGTINWSKVRKVKQLEIHELENRTKHVNIEVLKQFMGLVDGDGYISITKKARGYIEVILVISLDSKDLKLLQYLKSVLEIGRIEGPYIKPKGGETYRLVFNATELQYILFPMILYHKLFFLTNTRRAQFDKALYIISQDILRYEDIGNHFSHPFITQIQLPNTAFDYTQLSFFASWFTGFVIAEGSFFFKSNLDACFSIKQREHMTLFTALKILLDTTRMPKVTNGYSHLGVSSKKDIQNVVNFFSSSRMIESAKKDQYDQWLKGLKISKRYGNLNFPLLIYLTCVRGDGGTYSTLKHLGLLGYHYLYA